MTIFILNFQDFKSLWEPRLTVKGTNRQHTVNVEIFAQYIFSRISRMVSDARKYDVRENINHYRLNGIRY